MPRHLHHFSHGLRDVAEVVVLSGSDHRGCFGWTAETGLHHLTVKGLRSSLDLVRAARALAAALDGARTELVWAHARMTLPLARPLLRV